MMNATPSQGGTPGVIRIAVIVALGALGVLVLRAWPHATDQVSTSPTAPHPQTTVLGTTIGYGVYAPELSLRVAWPVEGAGSSLTIASRHFEEVTPIAVVGFAGLGVDADAADARLATELIDVRDYVSRLNRANANGNPPIVFALVDISPSAGRSPHDREIAEERWGLAHTAAVSVTSEDLPSPPLDAASIWAPWGTPEVVVVDHDDRVRYIAHGAAAADIDALDAAAEAAIDHWRRISGHMRASH
ncbi:MAG: hypothetical protein WAN59_00170 [Candidatus Baltobacteraceae bacterium]